jgi:Rod binding domain-containing protein
MEIGATGRTAGVRAEALGLRDAAVALETQFLSEMLKAAGSEASPSGFGGGAGEEQFASFLREEQARAMARAGGVGLADTIFRALAQRLE